MTGAADTLPEAVAIAIYMIETQLPGDLRRSASHELADSTKTFDAEFGGAFDLAVGNPSLVPDDLQVDTVDHGPAPSTDRPPGTREEAPREQSLGASFVVQRRSARYGFFLEAAPLFARSLRLLLISRVALNLSTL